MGIYNIINAKKIDRIYAINGNIDNLVDNLLVDKIKNDLEFANLFFNKNCSLILKNENLGLSFFTEKILDVVNHNEELSSFYNKNNYNKLRSYFINKYKLNGKNLDIIENAFGSEIIRYIDRWLLCILRKEKLSIML